MSHVFQMVFLQILQHGAEDCHITKYYRIFWRILVVFSLMFGSILSINLSIISNHFTRFQQFIIYSSPIIQSITQQNTLAMYIAQ